MKNNKIGVKNIYVRKNKFVVDIQKGKDRFVKYYKTIGEAIIGRNLALLLVHGDFSCAVERMDAK